MTTKQDVDVHPHVAIYFFLVALACGAFTMHVLSRWFPSVPYTVAVIVEGWIVGFSCYLCTESRAVNRGFFAQSVYMWVNIDPHLLLFTFLPALLFADSMGLNWHLWKRCLGQCLILAGPGVIIGAYLTACVAKFVLPYGFTWQEAMTFGAILAATDPVAVVAILKEVGAPPQLTMMVSGESLLNDGVAIVVFNLFKALALDTEEALNEVGTSKEQGVGAMIVIKYFCRMSFGGVFLGGFFGLIGVFWIYMADRKTNHADNVIQISITICLAYACFFISEHIAGVSGVLATVTGALVLGALGWPHFVSHESMASVWHIFEHIGNTLIFFLAGTILGDFFARDFHAGKTLRATDFLWLVVIYSMCMVIRCFMVLILYPILRKMGYGFSWQEAIVLSWGGLRGALGLALALDVDLSFSQTRIKDVQGTRILMHVGGVAILTLLINGASSAFLMKTLGMTRSDKYQEAVLADVDRRIHESCKKVLNSELKQLTMKEGESFAGELQTLVLGRLGVLRPSLPSSDVVPQRSSEKDRLSMLGHSVALRRLFLTMLRSKYSELVHHGVLHQHGFVSYALNESLDVAMDCVKDRLCDWKAIEERNKNPVLDALLSKFPTLCERLHAEGLFSRAGWTVRRRMLCHLLMCFIRAHTENQVAIQELLKGTDETTALFQVLQESKDEVGFAEEMLDDMEGELVQAVRAEQVANAVLESQRRLIMDMVANGALQEKQAHHLLQVVERDIEETRHVSRKTVAAASYTSSNSPHPDGTDENGGIELVRFKF